MFGTCRSVGILVLSSIVVVLVGCSKHLPEAQFDPSQVAAVKKSAIREGMPVYNGDGYALNADTWIICSTDQFGELNICHVDIRGRDATTGKPYSIRKWDFRHIRKCNEENEFLWLTNFFGPRKPMRLFFDGESNFTEVVGNIDKDDFFVVLDGHLHDRMESAKSIKVLHGIAASEISYVYDLSAYRHAVALADAACKKGPLPEVKTRSAEEDKSNAAIKQAESYINGVGVAKDYAKARDLLIPLAEQGNSVAQNLLATLFFGGPGVDQDYAKAFEWIEKSVAQGNSKAQYNLGKMFANGFAVEKDNVQAIFWVEKSASQGYALAQYALGAMYEHGRIGGSSDPAKAVEWYQKAAVQGDANAQLALGNLYWLDEGIVHDYAKALEWIEKSAVQGNNSAQLSLGVMYHKGIGVAKDDAKAFEWIQKSAAQGNSAGQHILGNMYEKGVGVAKDTDMALDLYQKAAAQGFTDAQTDANRLMGRMSKNSSRKH